MKFFRALMLIFAGCGLFLQVAAHAATPQVETRGAADCDQMAQAMPDQMNDEKDVPDRPGPCSDMTFECLMAMNCLPTLALGDTDAVQAAPFSTALAYHSGAIVGLEGESARPESPPPQAYLTV